MSQRSRASRADPDAPGVTYKMVKDYKVIMKIKKVQKKMRALRAPSQKGRGAGDPRPGLYTFSRLSGIREHTRLAREARVFADADKLFMVTLSGGLLLFCGGGQSERGSAIIGASKGPWAHHTHGAGLFVRVHRSEHLRKTPTTPRRGTGSGSRAFGSTFPAGAKNQSPPMCISAPAHRDDARVSPLFHLSS